jgi:hypothetical protein
VGHVEEPQLETIAVGLPPRRTLSPSGINHAVKVEDSRNRSAAPF